MALIECKECGKNISSYAITCPNCGCPTDFNQNVIVSNTYPLKDWAEWNQIVKEIGNSSWSDAISYVMKLTKTPNYIAYDIVEAMKKTHEIPVDLILEKIPDQRVQPTTKPCSACGKTISVKAETCPHCGQPTGVHVCPRCGSTDVVYIDAVSKVASMALFGIFSVNTVRNKYECWECHFKF